MGKPTADTIAIWVARSIVSEGYVRLSEAAIVALTERMDGWSLEQVAELTEEHLPALESCLQRIAAEAKEDGVDPLFQLSDDGEYIRASNREAHSFLEKLRGVSSKEFEEYCSRVLIAMDAQAQVVGSSGDECVDFVARELHLTKPATIGGRVIVVGQAKRYAAGNLVTETALREFVGGALGRVANPEDGSAYRGSALGPVAFAFWTTSDFNPSARRYARRMGLWYLGGVGLAQLGLKLAVGLPAGPI